ncbi:hypothetical protein O181_112221 [Austropuccinia psidii MF-1]|uniref:Chorismate mutase n=1 Tax=Austropuccinia psidii MF-1 TaxID=1389203 RepID=A0A9Q3K207_9BASI|nr:hypothetical protein [Austropuccinia psidii MF-1]
MEKHDPLNLQVIRQTLMRLEDTIIFLLIERAQFAYNPIIYEDSSKFFQLNNIEKDQKDLSFLDWILKQTEITHAKARRYEAPDEYPFTSSQQLPPSLLPPLHPPVYLHSNNINFNPIIKNFYINHIVPILTQRSDKLTDDGQYGSSATRDVEILQAVSRRIHYGKFVAESKFRDHPNWFIDHIKSRNSVELERLITKPQIEAALVRRLENKALTYGQEITEDGLSAGPETNQKINAKVVVQMYKDWVIPLTRQVEVEYLLNRLDGLSSDQLKKLIESE